MSKAGDTANIIKQPFTQTLGTSNYRAGVNAGNSIASGGNYNVTVGDEAGTAITTGDNNTAVGYGAGDAIITGSHNTFLGQNAGTATTGSNNTGIGRHALLSNTSGTNTAVGYTALDANTTGTSNVAVGDAALGANVAGDQSVAIGTEALLVQNPSGNADMNNVAVGYRAGYAVTTGIRNTLLGGNNGDALTVGTENVAVGFNALSQDTKGSMCVAVGTGALNAQNFTSATDAYNTAVGQDAGNDITSGSGNTFLGGLAGDAVTTASSNTAVGYLALRAICGNGNTALGKHTLQFCTGEQNTSIGLGSGYQITSGDNNVLLGYEAGRTGSPGGAITTADNTLCLGDERITASHVQVDWTVASDQRDKTDFTALDLGLDFVKALAPVTYKWDKRSKYGDKSADDYDLNAQTPDGTHKEDWLDIGFKAQEVQALEEAAGYTTADKKNLTVSTSGDGKQMGLQYSKFVPILVKAMQEQNALIEALTARITTLEG